MAKKVFLQDQDEKLLPITRGELVLDSSGEEAFHSEEFLANNSQPGLMSKEDKVILDVVKAQSTPVVFGQDTDTTSNWTGISDQITSYEEGMTIIYVPTKSGGNSSTKLQINDLEPISVQVSGYSGPFTANVPIFLTYIDSKWQFSDKDTTYTMPFGLYVFDSHKSGILLFKNTGAQQILLKLDRPQYLLLVVATEYTCVRPIEYIAFGNTLTGKLPLLVDGGTMLQGDVFYKGQYIAYCDGETCYINTDGTIPGKIEKSLYSDKAALAEQVEWNEVTSGETDTNPDDFVSTVANSQYLLVHNLGALEKNPSDFNTQVITAWLNQEGMPTTDVYSGINVAGVNPQTQSSWQLCSGAALNNAARLWFRSGIADEWKSWRGIAVLDDLVTHSRGESIGAGVNIDSKVSPGIYYSTNASYSGTLTNPPTTDSGFRLMTFSGYVANQYGMQVAHSSNNIYFRFLGENNSACSDWYQLIKFRPGTSIGSSNRPMYLSADGVPTALHYTIESSVPASAKFTDTKCASLALDTTSSWESEDDTVSVLSEQRIEAYGDGTYLYGSMESTPVPTKAYVDRTFKTLQNTVSDPTANGFSTTFISSISQNANGEITVEKKNIQVSAGDLGLTTAMKYIGQTSTQLTDGATTATVKVGTTDVTMTDATTGYVVMDSNTRTYVWNGTSWQDLGNGGAYKLKQTAVNSPDANGTEIAFIDTISQDAEGAIKATKKFIPKASSEQLGIVKVGDNLETDSNGVLSAIGYTYDNYSFTEGDSDCGNRYANFRSHMEGIQADIASLLNYSYTLNPLTSEQIQAKFTPVFNWAAESADLPSLDGNLYVLINFSYAFDMVEYLLSEPNETSLSIGLSNISGYGEITHTSSGQSFQCLAIYINLSDLIGIPCIIPVVLTFDSIPSDLVGSTFKFKNIQSYADQMSHVEGVNGVSTMISHSEGIGCNSFYNAHAEGCATSALFGSHTEGMFTHGDYASHAEGIYSSAIDTSHAEGLFTNAYNKSHAEGFKTLSMGQHSHAQGVCTVTSNEAEHAEGMFNKSNTGSEEKDITLSSIGIGSSGEDRKNAVEVMQNGDIYVYGLGNYTGTNPSEASTLQTVIDNLNGSSGTSGSCDITVATDSALGGIKIGYEQTGKNYPVVLDPNSNQAYVNVPWTDTKNTAGSSDSTDNLYIIGATSQDDNPQTYSNSNVIISGNAIKASGGFYQESDERLKDFTEDIQVDLEQLSQLPKKHFTWKNDSKKETQIGTSAQELQKLYPELVKEDSNGTLSVAYDKLSIIALKAIDELYKRNIELEKRIQELENK